MEPSQEVLLDSHLKTRCLSEYMQLVSVDGQFTGGNAMCCRLVPFSAKKLIGDRVDLEDFRAFYKSESVPKNQRNMRTKKPSPKVKRVPQEGMRPYAIAQRE